MERLVMTIVRLSIEIILTLLRGKAMSDRKHSTLDLPSLEVNRYVPPSQHRPAFNS